MLRSLLYVPGDQPRKIHKALTEVPVDAVILDLEDAVAASAKSVTRAPVAAALLLPRGGHRPKAYVRINSIATPWCFGDLDAVVGAGLDGILLPKTARSKALYLVDRYLAHLEQERGLREGTIDLVPLIETAEGAAGLQRICARGAQLARVRRLGFGGADLTTDLGMTVTSAGGELLLFRSQLVLYSRAAGLEPPLDTMYPHFRDVDGLEATTRRSRALGFQGRTCIHPDQVTPINRLYAVPAPPAASTASVWVNPW